MDSTESRRSLAMPPIPRFGAWRVPTCQRFLRSECQRGDKCLLSHTAPVAKESCTRGPSPIVNVRSSRGSVRPSAGIPCTDAATAAGCENISCRNRHDEDAIEAVRARYESSLRTAHEEEAKSDEAQNSFTRMLLGARVTFNQSGQITNVLLPTDLSSGRSGAYPVGMQPDCRKVHLSWRTSTRSGNEGPSDAETCMRVRRVLERYGILEAFHFNSVPERGRVHGAAWFRNESDARAACAISGRTLAVLGEVRVTITLVTCKKVTVATDVYRACSQIIAGRDRHYKRIRQTLRVSTDDLRGVTTLKLEGSTVKVLASSCRDLDNILRGTILMAEGEQAPLWDPSLARGGKSHQALKLLEKITGVLLTVDESKCELRAFGSDDKLPYLVECIQKLLEGAPAGQTRVDLSEKDTTCQICFCEAEAPVQVSCRHIYCLTCLESYSGSVASTGNDGLFIQCQGNEGTCDTNFELGALREQVALATFELLLLSAFDNHIGRNPEKLRFCPTPDCGFVYRSTSSVEGESTLRTCSNCLHPLCTSCHVDHGNKTCAKHRAEVSDNEALAKLKQELGIKDCPRCAAPMEKTEGCNHMVCHVCKADICWVCMKVFRGPGPCYRHMMEEHGGWGLPDEIPAEHDEEGDE